MTTQEAAKQIIEQVLDAQARGYDMALIEDSLKKSLDNMLLALTKQVFDDLNKRIADHHKDKS